ncbi:MAG: hypothetical protein GY898_11910, partial [Proteobacteria bacterium]|nr:hypothetical protein [Pseudomonadota bacterium]
NQYYTDARADARAQLKVDALVGGASAAFDTLVEIQNAMATDTELTSAISGLNHDTLSGFVASEHIDWTAASAGTIHASNYTDTIYTSFNTDFDTRLATKDTDDLTEGSTSLYYTTPRANTDFDTRLATKDTDDLTEGSLSLYYTDARARAVSIENIVEDTTPQLGGDLDLNTFDLSTTDPT